MTNITLLVRDRPALTRQALETIGNYDQILVLDDASMDETKAVLQSFPVNVYSLAESHGTGYARNKVIKMSEKMFGRGDYLYLSDNDVFFRSGWLSTLKACYEEAWKLGFKVIGAYNHPYHIAVNEFQLMIGGYSIREVQALALQSMIMKWEVWDEYGPFDHTPAGAVCMGEDVSFCHRILKSGGKLGVVSPALLVNTGVTNSFGQKIPGCDLVQAQCPVGVHFE